MANVAGPLPESLRMGVYEAYDKSCYGQFMRRVVALQEGTMSLEQVDSDIFTVLGFDGGKSNNHTVSRDASSKSHRPDLYRMFVQWSTTRPSVVGKKKKGVVFEQYRTVGPSMVTNVPGPLPESLRMGVYEAYGHAGYGQIMRRVVALQEGTMSLEQVDNDVFTVLGFDGGHSERYHAGLVRDASSKSHRPDLYRMFVDWSSVPPPVVGKKNKTLPFTFGAIDLAAKAPKTLCLDSLTSEVLAKDLITLDTALSMSPTMQTALRTGMGEPSVPFSFGALRLLWQKELLTRVSTDTKL